MGFTFFDPYKEVSATKREKKDVWKEPEYGVINSLWVDACVWVLGEIFVVRDLEKRNNLRAMIEDVPISELKAPYNASVRTELNSGLRNQFKKRRCDCGSKRGEKSK